MSNNGLDSCILKLLKTNSRGVSIEVIIDYLDYINKVRYSEDDIIKILNELIKKNKVLKTKNLFLLK
ncbi:hypothetical protein [Mariniflexile sp.]|uniref:hypothetical protein n=1 Tax=Mariniflexile sp. TaxID=1979402 RepID=UPI004047B1D1